MKVLLVEDDRKIASCDDGDDGYLLATTQPYDVIVLDIMLPGRDGLSILRNLRELKNTVPVILLTARSTLNERLEGLNLGADDYLCKPFFVEELVARIHAVTRRASGEALSLLQCGDLVINLYTVLPIGQRRFQRHRFRNLIFVWHLIFERNASVLSLKNIVWMNVVIICRHLADMDRLPIHHRLGARILIDGIHRHRPAHHKARCKSKPPFLQHLKQLQAHGEPASWEINTLP
jgi:CheY-like chemotaxis protein